MSTVPVVGVVKLYCQCGLLFVYLRPQLDTINRKYPVQLYRSTGHYCCLLKLWVNVNICIYEGAWPNMFNKDYINLNFLSLLQVHNKVIVSSNDSKPLTPP